MPRRGRLGEISILPGISITIPLNDPDYDYALQINPGSNVSIDNAGSIKSSDLYGIRSFGTLDRLVNDGTVEGDKIAAVQNSRIINNLTNNGTIKSRTAEVAIRNSGTITEFTNNGTTEGRIQNRTGSTIGTLTNSGTIKSLTSEVAIENFGPITEFTNSGTIEGGIRNGSTIGTLTNSGTITKSGVGELGSHAIYSTGTITNGIINTGTLDGDVTLGTATLNLNDESSRVTGAVSGSSDSRVNVNGTFTSENTFDVGHFEVASGATFNMAHNVTTTSSATFQNDGVLSIAATDAVTIQTGP